MTAEKTRSQGSLLCTSAVTCQPWAFTMRVKLSTQALEP